MTSLELLIGWAKVERAKIQENYLACKERGNEWHTFGQEERRRSFDLVIETAELLLKIENEKED